MKYSLFLFSFLCLLSCKRKWTDKDKNDFYSGCVSRAQSNKDIKNPKTYCHCLLQKVVAKYPNANDAKYIKFDSTIKTVAKECLKQQ